ncbi:MAG: SAP domain-containing protein [Candidatus Thermoplasmatota archaeon]|nr:SAP domain-containing protein [Candidatus Thermoplasmatota archaeon]
MGRSGNQQIDQNVQGQASNLFTALMDEAEEEISEGPTVDWSQSTFTMDDVTIEVSQYDDDGQVELSTAPSFATQFEDMPDEAKTVLPSNVESHVKGEDLQNDVEGYEELPAVEAAADEDFPLAEAVPDEDLPMVEAVPDEDLPMVEAVPDEDLPMVSESLEVTGKEDALGVVEEIEDGGGDPVPSMDEDELLSLTNAELRSMLSNLGAPTRGNKKALVERLLAVDTDVIEEESYVDEEGSIEDGSDEEAEDDGEVISSEMEADILPPKPPLIPDIPNMGVLDSEKSEDDGGYVSNLPEIDAVLDTPSESLERISYWPWAQKMPWTERDIAIKLKLAMEEAREKRMNKARDLLDETGPHLGERTRLLFPVCRLLQALGRGDEVPSIIAGAEEIHRSDPAVADARYRLGV